MFYRQYSPQPLLEPYVKCFWVLEHDYSCGSHREEWLAASAEVELIFHYGNRYELHSPAGNEAQPHCFVMGQQARHTVLHSAGRTGLIAVRFHSWGAFPFFRVPVSELSNQFVSFHAIGGQRAAELEERLLGLGRADALRLLESFCLDRIRNFHDELLIVRSIVSRITQARGQITISKVIERYGLSQRQVERHFQTYVGMAPKRLARLARFHGALRLILADPQRALTSIAYDCGYADQAHFTNEFHELFGKTPSDVRSDAMGGVPSDYDVEFLQSQ